VPVDTIRRIGNNPAPAAGAAGVGCNADRLMYTGTLAAALKSIADLAQATLLHPAHGHEEWRCWLAAVGATQVDPETGLVLDTLELTLTAAEQGHGVAIGDPRMARDRLAAGTLVAPFGDVVDNGLGYFLVYPSPRAAQPRIRALTSILTELAQDDSLRPA
jgi:LysR family transcriptional regulator, glycine cleavage system transcriptional activator